MYGGAYYLTRCFSSFILFIFTSTLLRGSLMCTLVKETSFYYSQPGCLFTFGVHLEHLKVGSWKFQQGNFNPRC